MEEDALLGSCEWKWDERELFFQKNKKKRETAKVKDPRTFEEPMERWRVQEKRKEEKCKKKEEREKEEGEVQKKEMVEKAQREDHKPPYDEDERGQERETDVPEQDKLWRSLENSSLLLLGHWLCVNAAAEGLQRRTEMMERMHQQDKGGSSQKEMNRTEMKKEAKVLRCTLLNGSAWCTESRHMGRFQGKCDIFCRIERRLRKDEMKEQFNREEKAGWRFAADAARITDERASSEDP